MGKSLRRVSRTLILLALAITILVVWKRVEITRLMAVNSLFTPEKIIYNFSHIDKLFPVQVMMKRDDGATSPLPVGPALELPAGAEQWLKERVITALVVLKDGELLHESYYHGTRPEDLRMSWSVSKSYLSVLIGILLDEGVIGSVNDPVIDYVPAAKESAFEKTTILNLLQMSSGVYFDENYHSYASDINRMGRALALGGSMDDFATGLTRTLQPPGEEMDYVSINTHILGMVARNATGRSIPDLMQEKLLGPMGLENGGNYVVDTTGVAFALGGLSLCTRDYARLGQMLLQGGKWNDKQIVSRQWIAASTRPSANTRPGKPKYGYHWMMPADARPGEYFAHGIYGQYIYVDEQSRTVIALNAADRMFADTEVIAQNVDMFRRIAKVKE